MKKTVIAMLLVIMLLCSAMPGNAVNFSTPTDIEPEEPIAAPPEVTMTPAPVPTVTEAPTMTPAPVPTDTPAPEPCTHQRRTRILYGKSEEEYINDNNPKTHLHISKGNLNVICMDCWDLLDTIPYEETRREEHYLWPENTCHYCGYESTCQHQGGTHTEMEWSADYTITQMDETSHTRTGKIYVWTICDECGDELDEQILEGQTETGEHVYYKGVCDICGYANPCTHQHLVETVTVSRIRDNGLKYTQRDDIYHLVDGGMTVRKVRCRDCGEELSSIESINRGTKEYHQFRDGTCVACGYAREQGDSENKVTIEINLNGGTVNGQADSLEMVNRLGEEFVLPEAPEREGYTFLGWYVSDVPADDPQWSAPEEGSADLMPAGAVIVLEHKVFVTAVWKEN